MASCEDESAISEITILPDGRVYVFGLSHEVLEILGSLNDRDDRLRQRVGLARSTEMRRTAADPAQTGDDCSPAPTDPQHCRTTAMEERRK